MNQSSQSPFKLESVMNPPYSIPISITRLDWITPPVPLGPNAQPYDNYAADQWVVIEDAQGNIILQWRYSADKIGAVPSLDFVNFPMKLSSGFQLTQIDAGILRLYWE